MKNVVELSDRQKIADQAVSWVLKFESGEGLSHEEKEELCAWLQQSNTHRRHFEHYAKVWADANVLTELAVPIPEVKTPRQFLLNRRYIGMAAMLLLIVGFFILNSQYSTQANHVYATEVGSQKTINLVDGSILQLNTNSRVRVDYSNQFREIYMLSGEAHFVVAKNKNRPFRVYAGNGRIHAIGTAFSVRLQGDKVDVTVSEGRVGIAVVPVVDGLTPSKKALIKKRSAVKSLGVLRAGEVGTIVSQFNPDSEPVQKLRTIKKLSDVDIAKRVSWTKGILIFSGEPLEDVVKEIGRYTDVEIEFSEPGLKQIRIGGNFPVGETDTMFSSLETNFGLQVTRLSSERVVISDAKKYQ